MRPKFVLALILLVALVLSAAFLLKQHLRSVSAPPAGAEIATPVPVTASNTVTSVASSAVFIPPAPTVTNTLTPEQRQTAIEAETDRLQQWSMNDDPASLSNILADLTNSEKEIREAAIEATKQFGSSDAIPTLKQVAADTSDTGEQIALLEAADFLSLPSISDSSVQLPRTPEQIQMEQQKRAEKQALKQGPKHPARQNSPAPSNP
jgi:hypothetical protein